MKTQEEILELFGKAKNGTLPSDFHEWNICDEDGWTIAHLAAIYNHLPKDFSQWNLAEPYTGWTVAHEAAFWGHLPDDFDKWNLTDYEGRTVADIARKYGTVPKNFKC